MFLPPPFRQPSQRTTTIIEGSQVELRICHGGPSRRGSNASITPSFLTVAQDAESSSREQTSAPSHSLLCDATLPSCRFCTLYVHRLFERLAGTPSMYGVSWHNGTAMLRHARGGVLRILFPHAMLSLCRGWSFVYTNVETYCSRLSPTCSIDRRSVSDMRGGEEA